MPYVTRKNMESTGATRLMPPIRIAASAMINAETSAIMGSLLLP